VRVDDVHAPTGAGMSSVTILLRAEWDGESRDLVVRLAPEESSFPVFPSYDFRRQYDVMAAVAAHSDVPVPPLVGIEETGALLGSPFIVMEAVRGRTPSDNPPYVFDGWLYDASPADRRALQDATADILARVHTVPVQVLPQLVEEAGADALRTHLEG
jgi:aminoglycoside phosphotransferase (APT) family kinase protein